MFTVPVNDPEVAVIAPETVALVAVSAPALVTLNLAFVPVSESAPAKNV